ncbi:MAG: tRNA dihydrouridine(20/20a) synthase DusA [Cardiobacteriaceae bacterium]|nr:tRNA dihydrouridine(20/20a) synthase DusA [Cardiobacteriaceae bacterium]
MNLYPKLSIAPMLDWTTPECRRLHRLFNPDALLYTEMIATGAIIYGERERHLRNYSLDKTVLQLGGGNPDELARAVYLAQNHGFTEINLNAGCPSDRVQHNEIGAILMKNPKKICSCLTAMQRESSVPISLKHRLGVDEQDERQVIDFIDEILQSSPCRTFIIHARKAWLNGLNPKENREIPPLNYDLVYEVKERFPASTVIINGGISTLSDCQKHLQYTDGVMIGRACYQNPYLISELAELENKKSPSKLEILQKITALLMQILEDGELLSSYTRHLLNLFDGIAGAKKYRRILSDEARDKNADITIWQKALEAVKISA